jgi:hypothetical protein
MQVIDAKQIADLFAWFSKSGIQDRNGYQPKYLIELKDLSTEQLRLGCQMMQKAEFKVVLWPQDFRRLCDGSWVPASKARREAELHSMRKSLGVKT